MRRIEQNLGEKRVLLGSLSKKNNLREAYEKLKLEEKAFISSSKFNRRQLLSRQTKLRQLQTQSIKGLETRETRTSFPDLPHEVNESTIRDYSNNLTLPYSRGSLRTLAEGKRFRSLLRKEDRGSNKHIKSGNSHAGFKDDSNEKQTEMKTTLKQKLANVEKDLKSEQVWDSGLHVGDIVSYSASYGKREKPNKAGFAGREDIDTEKKHISELYNANKNLAAKKKTVWKKDLDFFTSTERNLSDTTSYGESEGVKRNLVDLTDHSNHATSRQLRSGVFSETTTVKESAGNRDESTVLAETNDWLKKTNSLNSVLADTNTTSNELKSGRRFICSSLEQSQATDNPNLSITFQESNNPKVSPSLNFDTTPDTKDQTDRSSSNVPALVSNTPSWTGSEALPALGRIRRGSFCDVKTFTSRKVLDLLSSCEVTAPEKKESKQFLTVENENLKYCRYLRSVTPEETIGKDGEIPRKYRPSKHIIIGHTKVSPMQ